MKKKMKKEGNNTKTLQDRATLTQTKEKIKRYTFFQVDMLVGPLIVDNVCSLMENDLELYAKWWGFDGDFNDSSGYFDRCLE